MRESMEKKRAALGRYGRLMLLVLSWNAEKKFPDRDKQLQSDTIEGMIPWFYSNQIYAEESRRLVLSGTLKSVSRSHISTGLDKTLGG